FQGAAELLAQLVRSGGLEPAEGRDLLSSLVDQPLFAEENAVPADAPSSFFTWLSDRFLAMLHKHAVAGAEEASADDLLARGLVGSSRPTPFGWRGGRYSYDPTTDELGRRAVFRELQRLATLQEIEDALKARRELAAAAARKDADSARHLVTVLAEGLHV